MPRDGISEALDRFKETTANNASNDSSSSGGEHQSGQHAAVLHLDHGKQHSTHHIGHDGKATSEMHEAGKGGDGCPHCA